MSGPPPPNVGPADTYDSLFPVKGNPNYFVATSSANNEVSVWRVTDLKKVRTFNNIQQPKDVRMVDEGRALVLCNRELKLYNLDAGILETKMKGVMNQKMPFYGVIDTNCAISLSRNRMTVNIMNLETGDLTTTFKVGEDRFLNSLLVSANGTICVCGDETQKPFPLLVWDLTARKLLYDLRFNHHEFLTNLSAISDDAHYVVSVAKELNSSNPNFIVVYDLQSGMLFKKWKPEADSTAISISSQSKVVVNGTKGNNLIVWDLATGDKRHCLTGHTQPVDQIKMSPDGRFFLSYDSTGQDTTIRVWDVESGNCIKEFTPECEVSSCLLTSRGEGIVFTTKGSLQVKVLWLSNCDSFNLDPYGIPENEGRTFQMSN